MTFTLSRGCLHALALATFITTVYGQSAPTNEDPCHSYTYLSERNRNLYYQSYVYLCDNGLNGWFRFGGAAGSKMLNRCPIVHTGSHINCGTYYQGWIYGSEPSWYDGVVQRTVMFAYFGDCYKHRETVNVRNCGGFFVYGFSRPYSVPCNFRYCGMADQVHVTPSAVETSALYALDTISPSASITSQDIEATSIAAASTPKPPLDGCKYYQVLSESNRADYYFKRGFHGCDKHLNGWYRFMGDAGNRMLTKCPARKGSFCAAEFQGWLTGSNPGIHEGEVYRTVCFSRYYDCYCYYQTYIKVKNCGTYYVYKLDGVPSCNLRYCGAEDQMAKVECSNNYMRVILDTKYFNASEFSRITLRDPYCSAYISSSYISLGSVPNGCGASREETQRHIIYRNEVIMTAKQEEGMITRDHDQSIDVSCIYDRDGFGSSVSYDPIRKVSGNESGVGSFTFNFGMFRNSLFNSRFYSYPAKVKLRDYLYFEASASVQDNNLVLLVDQCYTTPDMNRNSHSKYMFINNGCPTDSTVQFLPADGQRQRISMQAFRYLKNGGSIYVHCLFLLCQRASRDFRCRSGCPGNNIGRVKRDVDTASTFASDENTYSKYYLLEAGPVVEENDQIGDNKNQGGEKQKQTLQSVVIGLVVGVAVLAFIVIGLVIKMRRRGPEAGKVDKAEDIGIDNAPNGKVYIDDNKEADEKESAM
ncbi:uromodulin-like isoform X2 [Rhopilema esculentum]|uniref:uromodulin-like isoform X2 n=1 Tax=Rhopilema esculentum TaxID=499914 RepID=UPI0031D61CE4